MPSYRTTNGFTQRICSLYWWVICVLLLISVASARNNGSWDWPGLQTHMRQKWGEPAVARLQAWQNHLQSAASKSEAEKLRTTNQLFNQIIRFEDDPVVWGQPDYWATPFETMGQGAGDCEDFVIAKYYTLLELGIPMDKLRLIYVRAKIGSGNTAPSLAHMVLAYYERPEAEPLVLDNLVPDIRPASKRPDLLPVFSFNGTGIYAGLVSGNPVAGGTSRLSRWEDLMRRARAEGFE